MYQTTMYFNEFYNCVGFDSLVQSYYSEYRYSKVFDIPCDFNPIGLNVEYIKSYLKQLEKKKFAFDMLRLRLN